MPDPAPSKPSAPRIAETAAGKALMALLALFYALLATAAAGGEWHTLFLPACLLAAALLLFCFCILRGYKIPSPGLPGWLALGLGGGYFLLRAWFSPWFYYEGVADLGLIVTAMAMFMAGAYARSREWGKERSSRAGGGAGIAERPAVGVPEHDGYGGLLVQAGLFPVRNGAAQHRALRVQEFFRSFPVRHGIFPLRVQHGLPPGNGASACSRGWRSFSFPSPAVPAPPFRMRWLASPCAFSFIPPAFSAITGNFIRRPSCSSCFSSWERLMPCWTWPTEPESWPPCWIRSPSGAVWTCPNWRGRWRTRPHGSATAAGCSPTFPRSFLPGPASPISPTMSTRRPPATTVMPGWG